MGESISILLTLLADILESQNGSGQLQGRTKLGRTSFETVAVLLSSVELVVKSWRGRISPLAAAEAMPWPGWATDTAARKRTARVVLNIFAVCDSDDIIVVIQYYENDC